MYKREIIDMINRETGYTKKDIKEILDLTLDIITKTLLEGEPVVMNKFGTFRIGEVSEHIGRSPLDSTEFIKVDGYKKVSFKPSVTLKRQLNGKE